MNRSIRACVALVGLLWGLPTLAELPLARLHLVYPPGGQVGTATEVTLLGEDLDSVQSLRFTDPRITARLVTTQPLRFTVQIPKEVPLGLCDVRAIGRFGVTNPRRFRISDEPQSVAQDNTTADRASEISVGSAVYSTAVAAAPQFYRVALHKAQHVWVNTAALSLDSAMEPQCVVIDPAGHEIAHGHDGIPLEVTAHIEGSYLIAVHDVLYRGYPEQFYRLSISTEADPELVQPSAAAFLREDSFSLLPIVDSVEMLHGSPSSAQAIHPPCEVDGVFRAPHFRDWYRFDLPAGAYHIEVISERLGEPAAPTPVLQRSDAKGSWSDVVLTTDPQPPTGRECPPSTRDPSVYFAAPEAGIYRLMVRNLFGTSVHESDYRLIIRRATPDFRLAAAPSSPLPDPPDSQNMPIWSTLIRKGGVTSVTVNIARCDGFNGEIHLRADHLPPGVTATETVVPAGSALGQLFLVADDHAGGSVGPIRISGTAMIDGRLVGHAARTAVIADSVYEPQTKTCVLRSRPCDEFVVAVSEMEHAPISIAPATTQASVGAKATIPVKVTSRAEFTTPIALKLFGPPALGPLPPQTIDPKAVHPSLNLDLAQLNLPPGRYAIDGWSQAKCKYTGFDGKSPPKDVTVSIYSEPFVLEVTPPPSTQPAK